MVDADKRTEAMELRRLLDQYCDEDKLPYSDKDIKAHATYIRSRVGIAK